jgi:hypothetical protein
VGLQAKGMDVHRGKGHQSWTADQNSTKIKIAKIDSNEIISISEGRTKNTISCKYPSLEVIKWIRSSKYIYF